MKAMIDTQQPGTFRQQSQHNSVKFTLTESELCQAIGVSRMTAFRLREEGKLSYLKIGKRICYLPRHIDEFLARCERRAK